MKCGWSLVSERTMTRAELGFVEQFAADLRERRLTWTPEWLAEIAARFEGPPARPVSRPGA